jgi:hypothetical protein
LASFLQFAIVSILEAVVLSATLSDLSHTTSLLETVKEKSVALNDHSIYNDFYMLYKKQYSLPVYFSLFIFAQLFQFYLCFDGVNITIKIFLKQLLTKLTFRQLTKILCKS